MINENCIQYTMDHRLAFKFVVDKLVKDPEDYQEMRKRAIWHDMDKVLLYTLVPKVAASQYHRRTSPHHPEAQNKVYKTRYDLLEAVIDFECAGYTKSDKPLNACDTLLTYDYTHRDELMEIIKELGIDKSYKNTPTDIDWLEYQSNSPKTADMDISFMLYRYCISYPDEARKLMEFALMYMS